MCGRFTGFDEEDETYRSIARQTRASYPDVPIKSGEIFPTDTVPVIGRQDMVPFPAVWGYPGFQGKGVLINARAETAATKYSFKDSLLYRRCVIPSTGYYEWSADKTKYRINLPNSKLLYLAGFYKQFTDGIRFVILTTMPNDSVSSIHNRMPVIIESDIATWIQNTEWALNRLKASMPELVYMKV